MKKVIAALTSGLFAGAVLAQAAAPTANSDAAKTENAAKSTMMAEPKPKASAVTTGKPMK